MLTIKSKYEEEIFNNLMNFPGYQNEKCNICSFSLPLLFNVYLLSYAFFICNKILGSKESMKKGVKI